MLYNELLLGEAKINLKNVMMPFSQSKTTFVRPLCESNNSGNVYKSFMPPIQPFTSSENGNSSGTNNKLGDNLKHLDEMKSKQLNNLNSVHSKLFAEVEEIQKWKTAVEIESRQKNKKVEELMQTIESQRKVVLDLQLQNENLSYRLSEEIQQRSFVIENLHSTKELCSALKKHYNTLQGQFDYRNKIEQMIAIADTKRMSAIQVLENKFEKICIEHSERIGYLNDALATETNKSLNLKESLEQEVSLYDNEKQSLCTLLSNSQLEIERLSKEIEAEIAKSRTLFQEKRDLEMNLLKLEKLNDTHLSTIEEMERNFKALAEDKLEIEKKYLSESLQNKEITLKYEECLETAKCFKMESEETILTLKQTIDNLECKYSDLLKSMEEEKMTNEDLFNSLQNAEKDKCNLDKIILDANIELSLFENLKNDYKNLEKTLSGLSEEKAELCIDLENTKNELSKYKSENESFAKLHEEKQDFFLKMSEEHETNMCLKEKDLVIIKESYDELQLKQKSLEEDILTKSELMLTKDKEIANWQVLLEENEKALEAARSDNATLQENFEIERASVKVCLECESFKDKIDELETIKNTLKKTEEELSLQKRDTKDTMRMLNESEKLYNGDRIAKEKELIQCRNQLRKIENEIKFKYVEKEIFNVINSENIKLKEDLKELEIKFQKLNCEDLLSVKKAAKKDTSSKHAKVDLLKNHKEKSKKVYMPRTNKEIIKICVAKFQNRTMNLNSTNNDNASPEKGILVEPEAENLNQETNSSSSDNCFDKSTPKKSDKENKAWEVDSTSSGSEYMDISFYQEAAKAATINSKPSTPKVQDTVKNKPLSGVQQKRDIQDTFSESTLAKRPCGGTPIRGTPQGLAFKSRPQFKNSIWTKPLRTQKKPNAGIPEHYRNKVNTPSTPITTPQRRFFKTPLVERDESFKKPKAPWF